MTRIAIGVGLALAFGIGCGAGYGASQVAVRSAKADAGPQKWEHKCFDAVVIESVTDQANQAGEDGWELVSTAVGSSSYTACFKRPRR